LDKQQSQASAVETNTTYAGAATNKRPGSTEVINLVLACTLDIAAIH